MLTPVQEQLLEILQKNPQFILAQLQDPAVQANVQAILGDIGLLYTKALACNASLLQKILANAEHPFTKNLVIAMEGSLNVVMQQDIDMVSLSEEIAAVSVGAVPEHHEYTGLSSHDDIRSPGADRGFTLLFSSNQTFFKNGRARKMDAAIAKIAEPADVSGNFMPKI